MGSGISAPLPDLPYKDITCIALMGSDSIVGLYAGQAELDGIRSAILNCWKKGIQSEKAKNLDPENPDIGQPKCYKFKLNGTPFLISGTKEDAIAMRRLAAEILHRYYNLGWKLLVSSNLSRNTKDVSTWLFQKQPLNPDPTPFFTIGISCFDKLQINDCPLHLQSVIREVVANTWVYGIQEEEVDQQTYTITFYGIPWRIAEKKESCTARLLLKELNQALTRHGYLLYGNSNLKSTADTFFYQYMPGLTAQSFVTLSLNLNDRLRLIQTDKPVIDAVEQTVREVWATMGGVQKISDKRPLCYELKLKGKPWWSLGSEAVYSRYLIVRIMEKLASLGLFVISGLDVSRENHDKTLFLFRNGAPLNTQFMCVSLNSTDKVKLINSPPNVVESAKKIFALWVGGHEVKPLEKLSPGCNYEVKLKGTPWSSMSCKDGYHGRALLLGLLGAFTDIGWRLVCSADVSSTFFHQDDGAGYMLDVHSWYFMFDQSLLAHRQQMQQQCGILYPTLPQQDSLPPSYYTANSGFYAPSN